MTDRSPATAQGRVGVDGRADDDPSKPRFYDNLTFDYAAFTSPIYVDRSQTASIAGMVRDPSGSGVGGAAVELCRTVPATTCVSLTTESDGSFASYSVRPGTWRARAFPLTFFPGPERC